MEELKRNLKPGDYIHSAKDKMKYIFTIGESIVSVYRYSYGGEPWTATVDDAMGRVIAVSSEEENRRFKPEDY